MLSLAGLVVLHDLRAAPCKQWSRLPLMLVADLADVPFRHPLYELAYGTSTAAEIRGYALADPWSFEDPGNRGEHAWSDVQSGEITVLSPLG
ncbi:MAG: hypothetical protein AAF657_24280, partial [Acidobacteriota bacterium]